MTAKPVLTVAAGILACVLATVAVPSPSAASVVTAGAKPRRAVRWLAAGDSYSSGEGLTSAAGRCQRADAPTGDAAWAVVAKDLLGDRLPLVAGAGHDQGFDFVACTGAVTQDLFDNDNGKQEWDPAYDGTFDLATFSFGGNDVGFSTVLLQCIGMSAQGITAILGGGVVGGAGGAFGAWDQLVGCPADADVRAQIQRFGSTGTTIGTRHMPDYGSFLKRVANEVMNRGGNVIVVGYPAFIEDPKFWNNASKFTGLCGGIRKRDALALRAWAGALNATIGQAVHEANNNDNDVRFTFVDVNTAQPDLALDDGDANLFEPATGTRHNLCAGDEWLNGITRTDHFQGSFHPKARGHNAIGHLVAARIQRLDWTRLVPPTSTTTDAAPPSSGDTAPGSSTPTTGTATGPWPTNDNEGRPAYFAWLGASFFFPAWTSCNPNYCIAGDGTDVLVTAQNGLDDVGTVPQSTPDPVAALVALGVPLPDARAVLQPGPVS